MKLLGCLLAVLLMQTMTSCSYDDSDLWRSVNGLTERLDQLESSMQQEINSLKTILEKLNQKEVTVDSAVETATGWTITFSDGTSVEIAKGGSGSCRRPSSSSRRRVISGGPTRAPRTTSSS